MEAEYTNFKSNQSIIMKNSKEHDEARRIVSEFFSAFKKQDEDDMKKVQHDFFLYGAIIYLIGFGIFALAAIYGTGF